MSNSSSAMNRIVFIVAVAIAILKSVVICSNVNCADTLCLNGGVCNRRGPCTCLDPLMGPLCESDLPESSGIAIRLRTESNRTAAYYADKIPGAIPDNLKLGFEFRSLEQFGQLIFVLDTLGNFVSVRLQLYDDLVVARGNLLQNQSFEVKFHLTRECKLDLLPLPRQNRSHWNRIVIVDQTVYCHGGAKPLTVPLKSAETPSIAPKPNSKAESPETHIFIGHIGPHLFLQSNDDLSKMKQYQGCFRGLWLGSQLIDLAARIRGGEAETSSVELGCAEGCTRHLCQQQHAGGQCHELWGGRYRCDCLDTPFGGPNCEFDAALGFHGRTSLRFTSIPKDGGKVKRIRLAFQSKSFLTNQVILFMTGHLFDRITLYTRHSVLYFRYMRGTSQSYNSQEINLLALYKVETTLIFQMTPVEVRKDVYRFDIKMSCVNGTLLKRISMFNGPEAREKSIPQTVELDMKQIYLGGAPARLTRLSSDIGNFTGCVHSFGLSYMDSKSWGLNLELHLNLSEVEVIGDPVEMCDQCRIHPLTVTTRATGRSTENEPGITRKLSESDRVHQAGISTTMIIVIAATAGVILLVTVIAIGSMWCYRHNRRPKYAKDQFDPIYNPIQPRTKLSSSHFTDPVTNFTLPFRPSYQADPDRSSHQLSPNNSLHTDRSAGTRSAALNDGRRTQFDLGQCFALPL